VKKTYFIFIFLLFPAIGGFAQTVYSACFDANIVRGCAPLTVTMIDCSGSPSINYFYDYHIGDIFGYTTSQTHTYTNAGIYNIMQVVSKVGAVGTDDSLRMGYIKVFDSPPPDFSVQVCESKKVNVKLNDAVYDNYIIDFGDGAVDTVPGLSNRSHTYTTIGAKTITVKGNYLPSYCGKSSTATITPLVNLIKPDITKLQVTNQADGNGSISLSFSPETDQKYFLEQSAGNNSIYTIIDTLPFLNTPSLITIDNLNTLSTQYCFRISSFEDCGITSPSAEVCSNTIQTTASNNQNQVTWSNYLGAAPFQYLLYRNGSLIANLASNAPYLDNDVRCGTVYCYSVITELNDLTAGGSRIQSVSDSSCVRATSTNIPTAIQNLHSTVSGNSVLLFWDKPAAFSVMEYQILRSVNGSSFSKYSTSSINSYTDNGADINGNSYCYMVNYTDSCLISSSSGSSTCPVLLEGEETGSGIVEMNWTSYAGCSNGVQDYTLLFLNPEDNSVKTSINLGSSLSYTDYAADSNALSLKYQIKASCNGPDTHYSFSNIFEISHSLKLFLPDAFTPNNDGVNDVFIPKGKYVREFTMTIFNRWGEIVFHTDKFSQGWDGNYKGDHAGTDAYAYLIEAVDYFGKKFNRKGTVTLLR
jgi:gliding motility-associated-like protein